MVSGISSLAHLQESGWVGGFSASFSAAATPHQAFRGKRWRWRKEGDITHSPLPLRLFLLMRAHTHSLHPKKPTAEGIEEEEFATVINTINQRRYAYRKLYNATLFLTQNEKNMFVESRSTSRSI